MAEVEKLKKKAGEEYWRQKVRLACGDTLLFPFDTRVFPGDGGHADAGFLTALLDSNLVSRVAVLCQHSPLLIYSFYLSAIGIVMQRYTRQNLITIGSMPLRPGNPPRNRGADADAVFFNFRLSGALNFKEIFTTVKTEILETCRYQDDIPAGRVLMDGTDAVFRGFDVGFCMQDVHGKMPDYPFEILFYLADGKFHVRYGNRYDGRVIAYFLENLCMVLAYCAGQPYEAVERIEIISAAEVSLIGRCNDTAVEYPVTTILKLFVAQCERTPDAPAIIAGDRHATYRELDEQSDRLAHHIRHLGINRGDLVPVCLERSLAMSIALWAVIKAGAAYVPVDPTYPRDRIDYILDETGATLILCHEATASAVSHRSGQVVIMTEDLWTFPVNLIPLPDEPEPGDLAYVIYTSGSTGKPKGVMIEHGSLVNRLLWAQDYFGLTAADTVLQKTSFCFDVSVWELFWPLLVGARLVFAKPGGQGDVSYLTGLIDEYDVTTVHFVPAMLESFLVETPYGVCRSLKRVLCSGEALKPVHVALFAEKFDPATLHNLYGPTEAAIDVSYWSVPGGTKAVRIVPIGRPVSNTTLHVLNDAGCPVPVGAIGELYIGGIQLARGYFNREELSAERFVTLSLGGASDVRLYKTGDLARWLPDGTIDFLGRTDDQIKIRGFRIEPGEVEHALRDCMGVLQALVLAKDDKSGSQQLVGYVVVNDAFNRTGTFARLALKLPAYMVPSWIVPLASLPLTANGKVDRKALPAPWDRAQQADFQAAETETERILEAIWKAVLHADRLSVFDNFFEVGGDSLKSIKILSRIHKQMDVLLEATALFRNPSIRRLATVIEQTARATFSEIPAAPDLLFYDLSPSQKGMWLQCQFEGIKNAYNLSSAFVLQGQLDIAAFQGAFDALAVRHEILRTNIVLIDGVPKQRIASEKDFRGSFRYEEMPLSGEDDSRLQERVEAESRYCFDLAEDPLLRVLLIRRANLEYVAVVTLHHIVSDEWSIDVLLSNIFDLYNNGFSDNTRLPVLRRQYKDFAHWQNLKIQSGALDISKRYWLDQLAGFTTPVSVPADYPRPRMLSYQGAAREIRIGKSLFASIKSYCRKRDTSLFVFFLTSLDVLLYRYTGQHDIAVGAPVAGRDHIDLDDQIGFYVNILFFRSLLDGNESFESLLSRVRSTVLEGYRHQDFPFHVLAESLAGQPGRAPGPLFNVMLAWHGIPEFDYHQVLKDVATSVYPLAIRSSKYDLTFHCRESADDVTIEIEYSTDLFNADRMAKLLEYYQSILSAAVYAGATAVGRIDYLPAAEKHFIQTVNDTTQPDVPNATLDSLFEEQVLRTPDAVALVFNRHAITYDALNRRSNRIAHLLCDVHGVGRGEVVAIMTDRSDMLVAGIMGIIKAGAAYMPIDPDSPDDRVRVLLADSQVRVILADVFCYEKVKGFAGRSLVNIESPGLFGGMPDTNIERHREPDGLAYVIFTSGSTGAPKGVMVAHRAVVNRILWQWQVLGFRCADVILQKTAYTFDVSVWEIFMSLCFGARLVVCPKETVYNFDDLTDLIQRQRVSALHFVPGVLNLFLKGLDAAGAEKLKVVRHVVASGEALSGETAKLHFAKIPDVQLTNLYGPTEAAVDVSYYIVSNPDSDVVIGKPVWNTSLYILDADLQYAPLGVPGEICIGGVQLAGGYMNRPETTLERFVVTVLQGESQRLYRTGDVGRLLPDGNIAYIGRKDNQVKIRGLRIEPGEIESVIRRHPEVEDVVVVVKTAPDGSNSLVAYIIAPSLDDVRRLGAYLRTQLPEYMVPSAFAGLTSFPLNVSGKVDRKALPDVANGEAGGVVFMPTSIFEQEVLTCWKDVLNKRLVYEHDSFFESGGDSLKAMRLITRYHRSLSLKFSLQEIFNHPEITSLISLARSKRKEAYAAIPGVPEQAYYPLSYAQKRLWVLCQLESASRAYNVVGVYQMKGKVCYEALDEAFEIVIGRHESLRTTFIEVNGEPMQRIHGMGADFNYVEHVKVPVFTDSVLDRIVSDANNHVFDLTTGPLFNVTVIEAAPEIWFLVVNAHHIISDGWSVEIMSGEIFKLYNERHEAVLPPLSIQYKDFASWQKQRIDQGMADDSQRFWKAQLTLPLPVLNLPMDYTRPKQKGYDARDVAFCVAAPGFQRIKGFCTREGVSVYTVLLAALKLLVYDYTKQDDLIIGTLTSGRTHFDLERQVGFYINPLPVRSRAGVDEVVSAYVRSLGDTLGSVYTHQAYPFDCIVRDLALPRDLSRNPLFDVVLIFHNEQTQQRFRADDGVVMEAYEVPLLTTRFDIEIHAREHADGSLVFQVLYNVALFQDTRMTLFAARLQKLLESIADYPSFRIADFLESVLRGSVVPEDVNTSFSFEMNF